MLTVCELFVSIQGESTRAGLPCAFVRLAGCNLRCTWCDTAYALTEGSERSVDDILAAVADLAVPLVEITGGEPLLQAETPRLCSRLVDAGYTVLLETNGTCDLEPVPPPVVRIADVKCPSSGHAGSFRESNFPLLVPGDECKFVIADRQDFDWALALVRTRRLHERVTVLFSPVLDRLAPRDLAAWILAERAPVRLGLQLHKLIWGDQRGV